MLISEIDNLRRTQQCLDKLCQTATHRNGLEDKEWKQLLAISKSAKVLRQKITKLIRESPSLAAVLDTDY